MDPVAYRNQGQRDSRPAGKTRIKSPTAPSPSILRNCKPDHQDKPAGGMAKQLGNGNDGPKRLPVYEWTKTQRCCERTQKTRTVHHIFQLRTGHVPLNGYLHRIKPQQSPACPLCNEPEETVNHLLFECRALADLRERFLPKPHNVENLLYNNTHILRQTSTYF